MGIELSPRTSGSHLWFGKTLAPRGNSLNLIRLLLAWVVLFTHSWYIVGAGEGPHIRGDNLGGWAVAGFFGISGYLITASRITHRIGDYLVHRIARIVPGFLVCLLVMVVGFGPVGYAAAHHGSLHGYLTTGTTPLNFLYSNFFLNIAHYDIAGTPANVPYPGAWNGSLWSLYYEFLCYLIFAVIGFVAIARRSVWPMLLMFGASVAIYANIGLLAPFTDGNVEFALLAKLVPFFFGGAVVQMLSRKVGFHWLPGVLSIAGTAALIYFVRGWGGQLASPLIAYAILWISTWLPQPKIVGRHDVSYGAYIYAFPVQQLLAVAGASSLGVWWFTAVATLATAPFAIASWLLVERPVMRIARNSGGSPTPAPRVAEVRAVSNEQRPNELIAAHVGSAEAGAATSPVSNGQI